MRPKAIIGLTPEGELDARGREGLMPEGEELLWPPEGKYNFGDSLHGTSVHVPRSTQSCNMTPSSSLVMFKRAISLVKVLVFAAFNRYSAAGLLVNFARHS